MLALRGKAQVGNMLHVIIGPETELFGDIHGAAVMDVTPLLMEMDGEQHVFLTLTHCRSEQATSRNLQSASITHMSSFGGGGPIDGNAKTGEMVGGKTGEEGETQSEAKPEPQEKGHCDYCNQDMELLPLPGFKICPVCAQIELGRLKQNTNEDTNNDPNTV